MTSVNPKNIRIGLSAEEIKQAVVDSLRCGMGRVEGVATKHDFYYALALTIRDRVFATYLHGPVLPKNPWLADLLLTLALERAVGGPVTLDPLDDAIEERNHSVALQKALRNRGQRTAIEPARLGRSGS